MPNKNLTKAELKQKYDELIARIQQERPQLYQWLIDKRIDFNNISKYASNFASALAIVAATATSPQIDQPPIQDGGDKEINIIKKEEFRGKTDTQRAQIVWDRYGEIINKAALKYNVDANLVFATIMIESGGDTYAIRHEPRINDASYGLGQILYGTARGIGFAGAPSELFDPEVNIDLIAKYHRRNMDAYDNLSPQQLTIAYNTGSPYKTPWPGHVAKFDKWYNRTATLNIDLT